MTTTYRIETEDGKKFVTVHTTHAALTSNALLAYVWENQEIAQRFANVASQTATEKLVVRVAPEFKFSF